jgi:hypothetical protein
VTFIWPYALAYGLSFLLLSLMLHAAWLHGVHPRPHFRLLQHWHVHISLAVLTAVLAGFAAGALAGTGYAILHGPEGLITPPVPAQVLPRGAQSSTSRHGLGLRPPTRHIRPPRLFGVGTRQYADLSADMPYVKDQGTVAACASWAVAYALRGYYARRTATYPAGGYAPYFAYAQLSGRANQGTSLEDNLTVIAQQGVDTWQHYTQQGRENFWDRPTQAERDNARHWRSQGYQILFAGAGQGIFVEQAIRQALVNGDPVVIGLPIYDNLYRAGRDSYYIRAPEGAYVGLHAMVVAKSDGNGIWLMSSWGTGYGLGGWIEVSYEFIDRYAVEGAIMIMPHGKETG